MQHVEPLHSVLCFQLVGCPFIAFSKPSCLGGMQEVYFLVEWSCLSGPNLTAVTSWLRRAYRQGAEVNLGGPKQDSACRPGGNWVCTQNSLLEYVTTFSRGWIPLGIVKPCACILRMQIRTAQHESMCQSIYVYIERDGGGRRKIYRYRHRYTHTYTYTHIDIDTYIDI